LNLVTVFVLENELFPEFVTVAVSF
jgi:hypothetical protein